MLEADGLSPRPSFASFVTLGDWASIRPLNETSHLPGLPIKSCEQHPWESALLLAGTFTRVTFAAQDRTTVLCGRETEAQNGLRQLTQFCAWRAKAAVLDG